MKQLHEANQVLEASIKSNPVAFSLDLCAAFTTDKTHAYYIYIYDMNVSECREKKSNTERNRY